MRTELTEQEWAQLTAYRAACINDALDGAWTVDDFRPAAAVCYAAIDQPAPAVVIAPGPVVALLWASQLDSQLHPKLSSQLSSQLHSQLHSQLDSKLYSQLYSKLSSQLYSQLGSKLSSKLSSQLGSELYSKLYSKLGLQLDSQLGSKLSSQLYSKLSSQLYSKLSSQLYSQLGSKLSSKLSSKLGLQLDSQLSSQLGGIHLCVWRYAWLSHWAFIAGLDGVTPPDDETMALTEAYRVFCTPVFTIPLAGVVIVCGQHSSLKRNTTGDLHCTDGPAWEWPDGTAVHALDGIRVPDWVVTQPDAHRILKDLDNTEQRRVAFAHLGWDRVVTDLGMTPIDAHTDPHVGTLYDLPEDAAPGPARLLVATNASPHADGSYQTYGLLCAPDATTAEQAQASLAGLSVDAWRALDGAS